MKITVRYFATLRERAGRDSEELSWDGRRAHGRGGCARTWPGARPQLAAPLRLGRCSSP